MKRKEKPKTLVTTMSLTSQCEDDGATISKQALYEFVPNYPNVRPNRVYWYTLL